MNVQDTSPLIHSLEARYYTDPEIFSKEQDGLLSRTWQFAGHVSQVRNAGDFFSFQLNDESLFCIRGRDGELRTFYNVCQHRAHQLVEGSGNKRPPDGLPCCGAGMDELTQPKPSATPVTGVATRLQIGQP